MDDRYWANLTNGRLDQNVMASKLNKAYFETLDFNLDLTVSDETYQS